MLFERPIHFPRGHTGMAEDSMLTHLGNCYFHQDYDLDAPTPAGVVRLFAEEGSMQYAQRLIDELRPLIESDLSESMARHMWLHDADAMYEPDRDGKTYIEWFKEIVAIVDQVLAERRQAAE